MPKDPLTPKDHAEAVALFRSEVVGALTRRDLDRGELRAELRRARRARLPPARRRAHAPLLGPHARALVLRLPQRRPRGACARSRAATAGARAS